MGERSEDDIETRVIQKVKWLPPVESQADLPLEGIAEGTMCYVEGDLTGEEEVWEFRDGAWHRLD